MAKIRYVYIPFVFLGKQGNRTSEWSCNLEQCLKMSVFYDALLLKKTTSNIFSHTVTNNFIIQSYNHFIFWRPLNWICVEMKTLALPSTCYCFRLSIGLRFKLNQSTKTRLMSIHFLIFRYRRSVCFFLKNSYDTHAIYNLSCY